MAGARWILVIAAALGPADVRLHAAAAHDRPATKDQRPETKDRHSGAEATHEIFSPSPRLFAGLFAAQTRARGPAPPHAPFMRQLPVSPRCTSCDRGAAHLLAGSPLLTSAWLARHVPESGGGEFGDNRVVADLWYDAVHRRIFTRSLVLHEVDDPADLRLGRAAGRFPNEPDLGQALPEGTTVGHVGFVTWTPNGFGAYFAALQGAVHDAATGYLDLATATGQSGRTRTGSRYGPEDLIKHVRLHASGQFEVGFETEPEARPDPLLVVRGAQEVEGALDVGGALTVNAAGGNVPHRCELRQATASRRRDAAASCGAGELAIAGGGSCGAGDLRASHPVQAGSVVDGWAIACSRRGTQTAFALCCRN